MSNQLVITSGAKVRNLEGVLTGTSGVVSSVPLGAANGVATLDSGGKVPVSQLPSSVVTYLGTWNAATNTPTLTNGVGDAGDMYICNVAGTVNFGAGPITFAVGDWVLYGSGTWQKSSGQNGTVTSVGASITGNAIGLTGSPITTAGTLAFAFAGTAAQYINGAGNLVTFPTTIAQAQRLITEVYNETGATLTKGTVVYINGGHGNLPTVTKAIATGDATSAQTYGVVQNDITDNNNGYVVVLGSLGDLDTQAYANGTQLYLSSTTAGAWTSVKQYAPAHLVYVGIVVRSHPTQGVVEVRIQNGFELDELHNVSAQTPSNNQGLFYNSSTQLWENKSIATALGYTPANDASVVHLAGTETITGIKTFSNGLNTDYIGITGDMTMDGSFLLKHVAYGTLQSGYTNLSGQTNGLRVGLFGGYNALLNFSTSGSYTYTFPNATGTIALTSDIPSLAGYVTLATTQTITGAKTFNSGTKFDLGLFLKESSSSGRLSGYVGISATATGGMQQLQFLYPVSGSSVFSLPTTGSFNYEFPAASGTVALLEFSQTFSGLQSFTNTAGTDLTYGAYLTKNSIPSFSSSLTVNLYSASGNNNLVVRDNGNTSKLQFQATSSYTYTFPASTGTLALTTDIPSITGLVPYTGATTDVTLGNFSITGNVSTFKNSYIDGSASTNGQLMIKQAVLGSTNYAGYTSFYSTGTNISLLSDAGSSNYKSAVLSLSSLTNNTQRIYTLPNASGTLALTSDLTGGTVTSVAALTIGTSGTDLSSSVANSTTTPVITLNVPTASATNRGALSSTDWTTFNNKQNALTNPVTGTGTTNYLPKFTGTSTIGNSAITDDGSSITLGLSQTTFGTTGSKFYVYPAFSTNLNLLQNYNGSAYTTEEHRASDYSFKIGTTPALTLASTGAATFNATSAVGLTVNGGNSSDGTVGKFSRGGAEKNFYISCTNNQYVNLGTEGDFRFKTGVTVDQPYATGVDAMVIKSNGNILIGTITDRSFKLVVEGTDNNNLMGSYNTTSGASLRMQSNQTVNYIVSATNQLQFEVGAAIRMAITTGGNVLIGTTTDNTGKLQVNGEIRMYGSTLFRGMSSNTLQLCGGTSSSNVKIDGSVEVVTIDTNGAERMRITSGGNVLMGKTSTGAVLANGFEYNPSSNYISSCSSVAGNTPAYVANTDSTGTRYLIRFYGTSAEVGKITHDGTNTTYATSSDYRLKENIASMKGALEKVLQLKPCTYTWKYNGAEGQGFIAHELAEVCKQAVVGEKDAVDKNGEPEYQGIDTSFLVATLTAAIQEQNQQIQELKQEIETLKNK